MLIEIRNAGCRLRIHDGLLEITPPAGEAGQPPPRPWRIPPAEVTRLVLETPRATLTPAVLTELARHGVPILLCDGAHRPAAEVAPALGSGSGRRAELLRAQVLLRTDTRRRLWKRVVQAKLLMQAEALGRTAGGAGAERLRRLARSVAPGDPNNHEATGAQIYWPAFMGAGFRRGAAPQVANALLDYGYAVLRAMVLRALHDAGLHPAFGIHHKGADNPGNLADDLMEPYRPAVDRLVRGLLAEAPQAGPTPDHKARLAELGGYPVRLMGQDMQLRNAVLETCRSHADILRRAASEHRLPEALGDPEQCPMPGAPCG